MALDVARGTGEVKRAATWPDGEALKRSEATMSFTDDEVERYARHLVLREVGGQGQQRL